ncbi:MAG: class I SAM-dependent methyltransferase [Candidatus Calescibacterium sp.]|nr:class I SAM-dependent methyltransferase [Candidatus Calescibacterium sp.]MCX7972407.1 class I SAM-dependent methyltransferase [bacterium]
MLFENREKTQEIYNTIILDSFIQFLIIQKLLEKIEKNEIEVIDIGTGLGIPSIPIIIAIKQLKITNRLLRFHLLEPKQKKIRFLEYIRSKFDLEFEIYNLDEKAFYSINKKRFDIVLCRAVFPPPKIFDIFKKYSTNFSLWQYSQNYQQILTKYQNKINQNKLIVSHIFEYQLSSKLLYTVVFKKLI